MIQYENLKKVNEPFFEEFSSAFNHVLNSGWYILGKEVQQFEEQFASYCGSHYCCGVANGLDALFLALRSFGLQPGDEVIVPSNTYIATILSIVQNNLVPVLVEPDIGTYNIDPLKIEEKISSKTRVILVVHLYGKLCAMENILQIAVKHNLRVIEDCAQAHGAAYNGRKAGTWGDFGAFSYYPTKNLGALGDAGSLTTDKEELHKKVMTLRNYGSSRKYHNEVVGVNSRLDEVQAAFLSVKLKKLDALNEHKNNLAQLYFDGLKDEFIKPVRQKGFYDVFHIYTIRHPKRDELKEYLFRNEIQTEIHYPVAPVNQKAMIGILDDQLTPIADEIHKTTLSLPISFSHTDADISRVIEVMNRF